MRVRAQDVPMRSPEDLNTVLNMTVDDALSLALQKTENQTLDPDWYEGILAKLGELERDAFTLGLASKGVRVETGTTIKAQLKDDVIIKLEDIVKARGFIYESEYRDACWNQSGEIVGAVNAWIMNSMIPLKRNPPKGDISEQYKKRIKKNLNNPNVLNMKASQKKAALRGSDKKVIEAFIDKTEDASPRLETDGTVLATVGFDGHGTVASWQNDKIVFEHHAFSRFEQWIFDYIEESTPKAYLTKRGQATDFAMEQSELERAILAWQPKLSNIKEWLDKVRDAKVFADIKRIWDQLWHTKEETDPMVKKTQPYRETVELEEGPALGLAHLQKAKKLLAVPKEADKEVPWVPKKYTEFFQIVVIPVPESEEPSPFDEELVDEDEPGEHGPPYRQIKYHYVTAITAAEGLRRIQAEFPDAEITISYNSQALDPHSELVEITPTDLAGLVRKETAVNQSIKDAMARALWVTAWADYEEEAGRTYPGQELMDVAPETPPDAHKAAEMLWSKIKAANRNKEITTPAGGDPEEFGFYLAMEALGHGVAWTDDHEPHSYKIPHFEYVYTGEDEEEGFEEEAANDVQAVAEYLALMRDTGGLSQIYVGQIMKDLGWNLKKTTDALLRAGYEIKPATVVDKGKKFVDDRGYIKLAAYVKWDQVDHDLYIGTVSKNDIDFRVDGREKGYRVDMRTIGPWEAIDDGVPFDTEKEAKAWAGAYYALVLEQGTVHPQKPKRYAAVVPHEGPDWEITKIDKSTRSTYRIEGNNLNRSPDDMDYRFHWEVDSVGDPRYFASPNIEITPAAQKILDRRGETIGGGDWRKKSGMKHKADKFSSDSPNQFKRYLAAVTLLDGEGSITLYPDKDPDIHIAIIHDGSRYTPGAAIYVAEEHEHENKALENAWEILEYKAMEDTKYVKELQEEWGEEWNEILTESFDGMVFTLPASVAAKIISENQSASKYITIEEDA